MRDRSNVSLTKFLATQGFPPRGGGAVAPDKLVNDISEGKGKVKRNERGPGVIWVNFCWVCTAGLSEPLSHSIVYSVAKYRPHLSHFIIFAIPT